MLTARYQPAARAGADRSASASPQVSRDANIGGRQGQKQGQGQGQGQGVPSAESTGGSSPRGLASMISTMDSVIRFRADDDFVPAEPPRSNLALMIGATRLVFEWTGIDWPYNMTCHGLRSVPRYIICLIPEISSVGGPAGLRVHAEGVRADDARAGRIVPGRRSAAGGGVAAGADQRDQAGKAAHVPRRCLSSKFKWQMFLSIAFGTFERGVCAHWNDHVRKDCRPSPPPRPLI